MSAKTLHLVLWVQAIISMTVVALFAVTLGVVIFAGIPLSVAPIAHQLFGTLATVFGGVIGFWLGSTSSSMMKTNMLFNSTPTPIASPTDPIAPPKS